MKAVVFLVTMVVWGVTGGRLLVYASRCRHRIWKMVIGALGTLMIYGDIPVAIMVTLLIYSR